MNGQDRNMHFDGKAPGHCELTAEQRRSMIAEAAYFRAEQRGFQTGDPVADWLAAEIEIELLLASGAPVSKKPAPDSSSRPAARPRNGRKTKNDEGYSNGCEPRLRLHDEAEEVKSVAYVLRSHPFVERLIGTVRSEYLDRVLFWNVVDLVRKLRAFAVYYNSVQCHQALSARTPSDTSGDPAAPRASVIHYTLQQHCRGVFQTSIAG